MDPFNLSYKDELADYDALNDEDEKQWSEMIDEAKSLGASDEEIREIFGEYERTPNIYDRQAEWVSSCGHMFSLIFT